MADNRQEYGFRWFSGQGKAMPQPERHVVATGQSFDINGGASNVVLSVGDPVIRLSTGGVTLCDSAEGAGGALAPFGIVVGIGPYWDAGSGKMVRGNSLPADVAWGTLLERQSTVLVVPLAYNQLWEIDCDDATTATTEAAYQAFIGEHTNTRCDTTATNTRAFPRLDISAHNTTSTLVWNIRGISPTVNNQDFSGNYVKLLVSPNVIQLVTAGMTGV